MRTRDEITFRMRRIAAEAERARLAGPQPRLRQQVGHMLIAIGRAVGGPGAEATGRRAIRVP